MDPKQIVHAMCTVELAQADIKAICKARGFSVADAGSPDILESFIASEIGLETAFASLERKDIVMLHFLTLTDQPVDITIFERLLENRNRRYGTFNQRYADVFKYVKTHFVRNGLIAFAVDSRKYQKKTKLEKLCFVFPTQFHSHLPSLFESVETDAQAGEFNAGCIREKLRQIIQPGQSDQTSGFDLRLRAGVLHIGEQPFSLNAFRRWQFQRWAECRRPLLTYTAKSEGNVSAMAAVRHAFSFLGADQWIQAAELKVILDVFCGQPEDLDANEICQHGWAIGCLVRRTRNNEMWYRWAPEERQPSTLDDDTQWMMPDPAGGIGINLLTIPLPCLETLAQIAKFIVQDGRLFASPDRIRFGRVFHDVRQHPLVGRLTAQSKPFADAFAALETRWGQQIVHTGLMIAQVKDIGLKVGLQKSFKNQNIIFLPNDWIAFPPKLQGLIQTYVSASGFAVKNVKPQK